MLHLSWLFRCCFLTFLDMWAYGTQLRPWSPQRPLRRLTLFPCTFNMKLSSHLTWLISPLLMTFLWGFLSHLDGSTHWLFHYYCYLPFNIFNSTLELLIIEKDEFYTWKYLPLMVSAFSSSHVHSNKGCDMRRKVLVFCFLSVNPFVFSKYFFC